MRGPAEPPSENWGGAHGGDRVAANLWRVNDLPNHVCYQPRVVENAGLELARRSVRLLAGAFSLVSLVLVLWVAIARFLHPAETEWMTGAVRDGVDRLKAGDPLYAAPSESFVPYIYPPLYFWLSATIAKITSTVVACRLVAIAATVAACAAIARLARALGATREWSVFAVALYVGSYSYSLYFFDLERVDGLGAAISAWGVAVLLGGSSSDEGRREAARAAAGGALLALGYFAKQPGLFLFVAAIGGLVVAREWRRAIVTGGAGLATFALVGGYLHVATHGWFTYYVVKLPAAHGLDRELVPLFWLTDAPKAFALTAASFGVVVAIAYRVVRRKSPPWRDVVFGAVVAGSIAAAFFLRAHRGGWINVLIAWTPFGCAAFGIAAARITASIDEPRTKAMLEAGLYAAICLQLAAWLFDPNEIAPGPSDDRFERELASVVQSLEKEGDVIVPPRGGMTKRRHFHSAAIYDVLRAGDPAPEDYLAGLREQKYVAMILAYPNETMCPYPACLSVATAVFENYFVAARAPTPPRTSRIGFEARPTWIMRPRKIRLTGKPIDQLDRRSKTEMAIVEMLAATAGPTYDPVHPREDVEELAQRMTAANEPTP